MAGVSVVMKSDVPAAYSKSLEGKRKVRGGTSYPVKSFLSVCPVSEAIQSLRNTRTVVPGDSKEEPKYVYDLGVVTALRGILGNKTYLFCLNLQTSLTSGTATIAQNVATNLTIFSEYSQLLALFDECKAHTLRTELALNNSTGQFVMCQGIETVVLITTPSAAAIIRLPCSGLASTYDPLSKYVLLHRFRERPWGSTVDEGVSAPRVPSGMNSTYRVCQATGTGTVSNSQTYWILLIRFSVWFRARA